MKNSQAKALQKLKQVRDALATAIPATSTLSVDGQKRTVADLLKVLDAPIAAFAAETAAQATLALAKAHREQTAADGRQEVAALKVALTAELGKRSPLLASFGFAPKLHLPLTAQQKVLREAKAKLTRKARGTLGKKQKLAVTSQGSAGLILVQPDGTQLGGVLSGPTAPVLPAEPASKPGTQAASQLAGRVAAPQGPAPVPPPAPAK